ncbi:hypothetical protein AB4915_07755 [Bifidobacterium dentium]|uniref:Gp19/Gp15/Gp42 family protein n=1 Tax=Bifidobacterium dentium TaxID=1689 RepID=UPI003D17529D
MADADQFASTDDLERRWHALTSDEKTKADVHLGDVTEYIKARSPIWRKLRTEHPRLLTKVTCDIVRRIMQADSTGFPGGATQVMQVTGSFTEQYSFASATGDMYLRDDEKRLLGIGAQHAFNVDMTTGEAS